MNFLQDFNNFALMLLSQDVWNLIEFIAGFAVLIGCIQQRITMDIFRTSTEDITKSVIKIGQLGLYGQMMMGIFSMVDGYFNSSVGYCHTIIILWAVSSALVKFNIYYGLFHCCVSKTKNFLT